MICKWWKNRKAQREIADQKAIFEWQEKYFKDIKFPILILDTNDYIAVSDLEEYYFDVDINTYAVNQNCELIDTKGRIYNFKKINKQQWAPDGLIGTSEFQKLKEKVTPLLYMKNHKAEISTVENIEALIELLLT